MNGVFLKLLVMGVSATIPALGVILLRLVLKRAPKWISCALWALVALRLIIPFSIESRVGVVPSGSQVSEVLVRTVGAEHENSGVREVKRPEEQQTGSTGMTGDVKDTSAGKTQGGVSFLSAAPYVWAAGAAAMLTYMLISYLRLKLKVSESYKVGKRIYICDRIDTPFILGAVAPKIYVPSDTDDKDVRIVAVHESVHLSRLDHIWKPLGFILLSVYWFNPVLWISYVLFCRDIEFACDEKAIARLGAGAKTAYSNALINCASSRRTAGVCPLAFGETGVARG